MTTKHTFHALLISASLAALIGPVATAAPQRSRQDGSGVARISTAIGDVSKRHGQSGDLVSAESGMPLVGGDTVRTGVGGRAELRLDASNFLRLAPNSEVRLRQLGERAFEIDIIRGVVAYTMLKHGEADVDLRTQGGNIVPRKDGLYRIELTGAKESTLLVRKGEAEVLLVGHEPLFSSLTAFLLNSPSLMIDFKKAGIVAIDMTGFGPQPHGVLRWYLTPKLA